MRKAGTAKFKLAVVVVKVMGKIQLEGKDNLHIGVSASGQPLMDHPGHVPQRQFDPGRLQLLHRIAHLNGKIWVLAAAFGTRRRAVVVYIARYRWKHVVGIEVVHTVVTVIVDGVAASVIVDHAFNTYCGGMAGFGGTGFLVVVRVVNHTA